MDELVTTTRLTMMQVITQALAVCMTVFCLMDAWRLSIGKIYASPLHHADVVPYAHS
jgi:hypothetical protein